MSGTGGADKCSVGPSGDLTETARSTVGPGGVSACAAETPGWEVAMERLREIVADFETTDDPLTRDEVEAARVLLRHDRGGPLHEVRHAEPGL
ncbi:hypothetical protein FNQ90_04760 [Streptomyces alkaliphilus]|uniref:Uncharacterized protein n=1 Tax=Streptomyces alkaliphilus TaxID=1472722 RepID=A0A7W3TAV2_9ACTN|nr:hypothetical protein [Streptomyces alkaliphilus]